MKRPRTAAERVFVAYWAVIAVLGSGLVLVAALVALSYQGGDNTSTWTTRVMMLAVIVLFTAIVIYVARNSWQRAVTRPFPDRGLSRWMARQPGLRLVAIFWAPVVALIVGLGVGLRLPWFFIPLMLASTGIPIVGSVAQTKILWQRHQERSSSGLARDVARGSHDSQPEPS